MRDNNTKPSGWRIALAGVALALLAGCAGTIKQDTRVQGDVSRIEGVAVVVARMSPDAVKQQADNPQFNRDELASYLRRRLESKGLVAPSANHKVDIVVTDIRVRSGVAAIMLGFLAGDDHVNGVVRVMDANGMPLRSFEVKATYSFGGLGGGQDTVRMTWLYDKFSEMASAELEKVIGAPRSGMAVAMAGVSAATPPATPAAVPLPDVAALPTTGNLDDVAAVPLCEKGRDSYRTWLGWKPPRAFVVADGGCRWNFARGTNPADPMMPRDPVARALKICQDMGRTGCTLYAVDHRVVYVKPATTAAQK
jgi:hypothetical protein